MTTVLSILLVAGVVLWLLGPRSKDDTKPQQAPAPVVRARRGGAGHVPREAPPADAHRQDDGAFVDGYLWGRLEERHRQQGSASAHQHHHEHDMEGEHDD